MIDFYFVFFSDYIIVIALFTVWGRISACVQWSSAASSVIEFVYILILTPVDEERTLSSLLSKQVITPSLGTHN